MTERDITTREVADAGDPPVWVFLWPGCRAGCGLAAGRRRPRALSWASLAWMTVEGAAGITAGVAAGSIALTGWALTSAVEAWPASSPRSPSSRLLAPGLPRVLATGASGQHQNRQNVQGCHRLGRGA